MTPPPPPLMFPLTTMGLMPHSQYYKHIILQLYIPLKLYIRTSKKFGGGSEILFLFVSDSNIPLQNSSNQDSEASPFYVAYFGSNTNAICHQNP